MGKPSTGGGGGSNLFTSNQTGDGTFGTSLYIDLGVIPTGFKTWFGTGQYASPDKSATFELRTNIASQSTGTDSNTTILGSISAGPRTGTVTADYYKNGRLHTASVIGSGVEKCWLKIKSKSGTLGSYFYSINYTTE